MDKENERISELSQAIRKNFTKEFEHKQLCDATAKRLKENIISYMYRIFPEIKKQVRVERGNIYITKEFNYECGEITYYLPYILGLGANMPYGLYIDEIKVSEIEYEERLDTKECGYIVTVRETIKRQEKYITILKVN